MVAKEPGNYCNGYVIGLGFRVATEHGNDFNASNRGYYKDPFLHP